MVRASPNHCRLPLRGARSWRHSALVRTRKRAEPVNPSNFVVNQIDPSAADLASDESNTKGIVYLNESQLGTGYVNVADASGNWVLQNMPVNQPSLPVSYLGERFNLGTPDNTHEDGLQVNLSVDFSNTPLSSYTPSTPVAITIAGSQMDGGEGRDAAAPRRGPRAFAVAGTPSRSPVKIVSPIKPSHASNQRRR